MPKLINIPAQTQVLLHLDNNLNNAGAYPVTLTNGGSVNVSYGTAKFGSNSAKFANGAPGSCFVQDTSAAIPIGEFFTIDFWFKYVSGLSNGQQINLVICGENINFTQQIDGGHIIMGGEISTTTNFSAFTHIAVIKDGPFYNRVYINGTKEFDSFLGHVYNYTSTYPIQVGHAASVSVEYYIDELRISRGIKWSGNFTPPTQAYDN